MKEIRDYWEKRARVHGKSASTYMSGNKIYDVFFNTLMTFFHRRHLRAALQSCKPLSVLEVGCGYGRLLSTANASLKVGVDISLNILHFAKNKCKGAVILADTQYLPFRSKSFDLTYTCVVLQHVPYDKIGAVVNEIKRVTNRHILVIEPLPVFKHKDRPYAQGGYLFPHDYRKLFNLPISWNLRSPKFLRDEAILFSINTYGNKMRD